MLISFLVLILNGFCQCNDKFVQLYLNEKDSYSQINHWPIDVGFTNKEKGTVFFLSTLDTIKEEYFIYGVMYNHNSESYIEFGVSDFDPSFSDGVISVFFENVDCDSENEMIVLVEKACRTFYADGGYAGIKAWYQTHVYDLKSEDNLINIIEYNLISELLTVNAPMRMGTRKEEKLLGRETGKDLDEILGVTRNAKAIRKRILYLKNNGILGEVK